MKVDGGQLINILRGAEELSVAVLVCVHGRTPERLINGRHDLDMVL